MATLIHTESKTPLDGTIGGELILSCKATDIAVTLEQLRDSLSALREAYGLLHADAITRGNDIVVHIDQLYDRDIRGLLHAGTRLVEGASGMGRGFDPGGFEAAKNMMAAKASCLLSQVEDALRAQGVIEAKAA
jgi:hypothetical protein